MEIHTSPAELKMEGTAALIRLGPRASALLAEHGFSPGGDVVARLTRERLQIRPVREGRSLQERVRDILEELALLESRMRSQIESLGEVPDAMVSHQIPYSLEAELRTTLEIVLGDDLASARHRLEEALKTTPERLRREWELQFGGKR